MSGEARIGGLAGITSWLKNSAAGCSNRSQRRGARTSHMADSLWHIVGTIRYKPYAIGQLE